MKWPVRVGLGLWIAFALALAGLGDRTSLASPATKTGARRAPRLKLWDRVLYDRWEKADRLTQEAEQLLAKRNFAEAAARLEEALKVRPYAAALWFGLGTVHSLSGRYGACVEALARCRKLDSTFRPSLVAFRMGLCLSLSGRVAAGTREYQKVSPGQSVSGEIVNWNLGDNHMALGRLTEAVAHYREALRYNPGRRVLHFALAVALDRQGHRQAADRRMKRALQLDPKGKALDSGDIIWLPAHDHHYYRALRHQVAGERAQALAEWQRFLKAAPRGPWAWGIRRRAEALRARPLGRDDLHPVTGAPDREMAVAALAGRHSALRRCLGSASGEVPLEQLAGVSLSITLAKGGRVTAVSTRTLAGSPPADAPACLQREVSRTRFPGAAAGPAGASFSIEVVGP